MEPHELSKILEILSDFKLNQMFDNDKEKETFMIEAEEYFSLNLNIFSQEDRLRTLAALVRMDPNLNVNLIVDSIDWGLLSKSSNEGLLYLLDLMIGLEIRVKNWALESDLLNFDRIFNSINSAVEYQSVNQFVNPNRLEYCILNLGVLGRGEVELWTFLEDLFEFNREKLSPTQRALVYEGIYAGRGMIESTDRFLQDLDTSFTSGVTSEGIISLFWIAMRLEAIKMIKIKEETQNEFVNFMKKLKIKEQNESSLLKYFFLFVIL